MPLKSLAANSRPFSPGGKRLDAFDILKGIGILLMIVGHSTGSFASLRNFIFSFHMPLFFLVAGYFFRPLPVWTGIRKNFRRLYVPYLFTALLLALHMMIVAYCHDQDVWGVFLTRLRATLLGSGAPRVLGMKPAIGAIWFLAAMFWSLLWLNLAFRTRFPWLVCLLLAALSFSLQGVVFLPQSIQPACSATLFLYVGYEVRRHALPERAGRLTVSGLRQVFCPPFCNPLSAPAGTEGAIPAASRSWLLAAVCGVLWATALSLGRLEMSFDYYRLWYFDMLAAVAAVWLVYQVSCWIDTSRFSLPKRVLCFFGRYSLVVLCFHLYELNCIPWQKIFPLGSDGASLSLLWGLKFAWAALWVCVARRVPFLRAVFRIEK